MEKAGKQHLPGQKVGTKEGKKTHTGLRAGLIFFYYLSTNLKSADAYI